MKLKNILVIFMVLLSSMTSCSVFSSTSPPLPIIKPFDINRKDSVVSQEIKIREYRSYILALKFAFSGSADQDRVLALTGDGSYHPDGSYANPGIIVPIRIKIIKLDNGKELETVYDGITKTQAMCTIEWKNSTKGYFSREIITIDLKPGMYRIDANTIEDTPEFKGTPSYFMVHTHWQLKFLPGAVNKKDRQTGK